MRADYVKIVQRRLADPKLKTIQKKLSVYGIAKELTELGHRAPRAKKSDIHAKVPYRVAKRLAQLVGNVAPLPVAEQKNPAHLSVGDLVRVISPNRRFHGVTGEVREVLRDDGGYNIAMDVPMKGRVLRFVRTDEVRHLPR